MPHILVAEDEPLIAAMIADVLTEEGFRVTMAANGREALEALAGDPADLLITNLQMPVMDGNDLISRIRHGHPRLPILVTTGFDRNVPSEEQGLLMVMMKPFLLGKFLTNIRLLTGHPATEAAGT